MNNFFLILLLNISIKARIKFNIHFLSDLFVKYKIDEEKVEETQEKFDDNTKKNDETKKQKVFAIEEEKTKKENYLSYNNISKRFTNGVQLDLSIKNYWSFGLNFTKINDSSENLNIVKDSTNYFNLQKTNNYLIGPYLTFWVQNLVYLNFLIGLSINESYLNGYVIAKEKDKLNRPVKGRTNHKNFYLNLIFSIGIKLARSITVYLKFGLVKDLSEQNSISEINIYTPNYYYVFNIGFRFEQDSSSKHTVSLGSLKNL